MRACVRGMLRKLGLDKTLARTHVERRLRELIEAILIRRGAIHRDHLAQ